MSDRVIQVVIEMYQGLLSDVSLFDNETAAMEYLTGVCEERIECIEDFQEWQGRHYQGDSDYEIFWQEAVLNVPEKVLSRLIE